MISKTYWAPNRSTPRSYTSLPRCGPGGLIQKQGRKTGFPFEEHDREDREGHECQNHNFPALQNLRFSCYKFENMDLVPILENDARTNTKHESRQKLSDQNMTFTSKT